MKFSKKLIALNIVYILIILGVFSFVFLSRQEITYILSTPHLSLEENFISLDKGIWGSATGFLKFVDGDNQPELFRQYYEISALDAFNEKGQQYFSVNSFLATRYIPLFPEDEQIVLSENGSENTILLKTEENDYFFIDKESKKILVESAKGDNAVLITNNEEYKDFMRSFIRDKKLYK